jgi:hypothetical protein
MEQREAEEREMKMLDPKIVGPGYWNILHKKAMLAVTKQQQEQFAHEFRELSELFPCIACRKHWQDYINKNPPEQSIGTTAPTGSNSMFVYVWTFHNSVNVRIGKKYLDWPVAFSMYYDN